MTDEERALKRQRVVGREVEPHELPDNIRFLRLESIITDLERRIKHLENQDDARGMSGIMIGGFIKD